MKRGSFRLILAGLLALTGFAAAAGEIRLANGKKLSGTVKNATEAGLEVETTKGVKTISWSNLSAGTRYFHQPLYRANFETILQGQPPSARTNQVERSS